MRRRLTRLVLLVGRMLAASVLCARRQRWPRPLSNLPALRPLTYFLYLPPPSFPTDLCFPSLAIFGRWSRPSQSYTYSTSA